MFYPEPANVSSYCVSSMLAKYWRESARCPAYATATITETFKYPTSRYDFLSHYVLNQPAFADGITDVTGVQTSTYVLSKTATCYFTLPSPSASPCCGKCTVGPSAGSQGFGDWFINFTDPLKVFYWPSTHAPSTTGPATTPAPKPAVSTVVDSNGFTL